MKTMIASVEDVDDLSWRRRRRLKTIPSVEKDDGVGLRRSFRRLKTTMLAEDDSRPLNTMESVQTATLVEDADVG